MNCFGFFKNKKSILFAFFMSVFLLGCASSQMQTNVQMTQSIFLNPVPPSERNVYIQVRNTSGQNVNLMNQLVFDLQGMGYNVVYNPYYASFVLMVNVLYCNTKQDNHIVEGAVIGGLGSGAVAGLAGEDLGDSLAIGAAGALAGGVIGDLESETTYEMQVDVLIKQKIQNNFNQNFTTVDPNTNNYYGATGNPYEQNPLGYSNYSTTIVATAKEHDLNLYQAIPILEQKIAMQIAQIF